MIMRMHRKRIHAPRTQAVRQDGFVMEFCHTELTTLCSWDVEEQGVFRVLSERELSKPNSH
jgi:hypothetical protein